MVTIAAVNVGNYRGRGAQYVNALYRGCRRHLTRSFRFACFTDDANGLDRAIETRPVPSGLQGWYNKLALFRPEAFEQGERVFYIDLDTVILGNIDDVVSVGVPLAMLNHPRWTTLRRSCIMAWEAGRYTHVWDRWTAEGCPTGPGGDQVWIARQVPDALALQDLFPGRIVSFKQECFGRNGHEPKTHFGRRVHSVMAEFVPVARPKNASIVYFHGRPRPDQCWSRWVQKAWLG